MACPHCNDTGFMNVRYGPNNERVGMTKCVCRTRKRAEQEKKMPGGFSKLNYELPITNYELKSLGNPDREIAAIILKHRGKENAVSIEEICKTLWPREWNYGYSGEELRKNKTNLIRTVKASVERIRTEARIPVAAHKGSGGGYYIPETAEECDDCYRRLFGEGVKLILLSRLFRPEADVVRELAGQLRVANSE